MSRQPFISICIPAYNQVEFLRRNLESICIQEYRDFEVVVTDDSPGSMVEDLVTEYMEKLPLIYYRNSTSLGSPANWNRSIELATGKYIKMMHHDDWFSSSESLKEFARAAVNDSACTFFFCISKILNVAEQTVSVNAPEVSLRKKLSEDPAVLFNYNFVGSPSAVMFMNNGQRFDEKLKYLVDVEFYIRMLRLDNHFRYINQALIVNTSNHAGQVTAASLNREIQVGEYSYLYNRVFGRKIPGRELSMFFTSLFKMHGINHLREIEDFGYPVPRPKWYFRLLVYMGKLKNS